MSELLALKEKYESLLALRTGSRGDLRALAGRFPGALREADDLPLEAIEARIEALERALQDEQSTEPWMHPTARFHALARGALTAKRWLNARPAIDADRRGAFEQAHAGSDAMAWCDHLDRIASPPRGRITLAVFERLAEEQGLSVEEARLLVQPHARVRR